MKRREKYWLYFVIIFFSFHLVRDILQDLQIHTLVSDTVVKWDQSRTPKLYWQVINTYLIEGLELLLTVFCLYKKRFGILGNLTIVIALIFWSAWLFYWIFL